MKSVEDENELIRDEMNFLRRQVLRTNNYKTCDSLRVEIEYLHETLRQFTIKRDNLNMIFSNQITYNKSCIGYQSNSNTKKFKNICLAKNKMNHIVYK